MIVHKRIFGCEPQAAPQSLCAVQAAKREEEAWRQQAMAQLALRLAQQQQKQHQQQQQQLLQQEHQRLLLQQHLQRSQAQVRPQSRTCHQHIASDLLTRSHSACRAFKAIRSVTFGCIAYAERQSARKLKRPCRRCAGQVTCRPGAHEPRHSHSLPQWRGHPDRRIGTGYSTRRSSGSAGSGKVRSCSGKGCGGTRRRAG